MYARILKYTEDQPRVPSGSSHGGEFASTSSSTDRGAGSVVARAGSSDGAGAGNSPFGAWETTLHSAIAHVLQGEKDDGFEHAQIFGSDGKVAVTAYGDKTSISFLPSELSKMKPGMTLVHNHPNASSLSAADMLLAAQKGLTVYAVDQGGGKYWSTGLKGDTAKSLDYFQYLSAKVQLAVHNAVAAGTLQASAGPTVIQHVINLVAQKKKIIDYHYSLGIMAEAAYAANNDFYEGLVDSL